MASSVRPRGVRIVAIASVLIATLLGGLASAGSAQGSLELEGTWGGGFRIPPFPSGIADFGPDGDIFIAAKNSARVIHLGPDRRAIASWGSSDPTPPANGSDASGLAVDDDSNVYVVDRYQKTIRKFSESGEWLDEWPVGGNSYPAEIAIESGSLYVLGEDFFSGALEIRRFLMDGQPAAEWTVPTQSAYGHSSIAGDGAGNLFVTGVNLTGGNGTKSIYRYSPSGVLASTWNSPAEVTYVDVGHGGTSVSGIRGYTGITPAPDGGAFVSGVPGEGITELSPAGAREGGYGSGSLRDLARGPDGYFWADLQNILYEFGEFQPDGTLVKAWRGTDLPKYDGDRGEGKFGNISDLDVGSQGDVFALDLIDFRIQRFGPEGQFENLTDGYFDIFGATELVPDNNGGYTLLNSLLNQGVDHDADGNELNRFKIPFAHRDVSEAVRSPSGGLVFLAAASYPRPFARQTLTRTDSTGNLIDVRYLDQATSLAYSPAGDLMVATQRTIQKYEGDGTISQCWMVDLPTESSVSLYPHIEDFTVAQDGTVLVLTGDTKEIQKVQEYTAAGKKVDETVLPDETGFGKLEMGPSNVVYLAGSTQVHRYEWLPSSGPAEPAVSCNQQFQIESVKFMLKRRWATVDLAVPEAGVITVAGKSIKARRRSVTAGGDYTFAVQPEPGYLRPVRKMNRRKVKVDVRFAYTPTGGSIQQKHRTLTFLRPLAGKRVKR
ncbi:MAG: hypothetical protein ACSLFD_10320 [Solirubrobacterales bacterium]